MLKFRGIKQQTCIISVSVGWKFKRCFAGWLQLRVSHEVAVKMLAKVAVPWRPGLSLEDLPPRWGTHDHWQEAVVPHCHSQGVSAALHVGFSTGLLCDLRASGLPQSKLSKKKEHWRCNVFHDLLWEVLLHPCAPLFILLEVSHQVQFALERGGSKLQLKNKKRYSK